MNAIDLTTDAFRRVRELVHEVTADVSTEELGSRLDPDANSIAWLVWHLTRIQDDHIAKAASSEQVWTAKGWFDRFGLPFEPGATGYGQDSEEVAAVRVESAALLTGYYDAVHSRTEEFLRTLSDDDLARVVDRRWDPPVTLGVRLVSIVADDLQHVGQAALVRGVLLRQRQ